MILKNHQPKYLYKIIYTKSLFRYIYSIPGSFTSEVSSTIQSCDFANCICFSSKKVRPSGVTTPKIVMFVSFCIKTKLLCLSKYEFLS